MCVFLTSPTLNSCVFIILSFAYTILPYSHALPNSMFLIPVDDDLSCARGDGSVGRTWAVRGSMRQQRLT